MGDVNSLRSLGRAKGGVVWVDVNPLPWILGRVCVDFGDMSSF